MHPITLRLKDDEHERGYRLGRFTESYGTIVNFCGCFTGLIGIHVAAHPSAGPLAQAMSVRCIRCIVTYVAYVTCVTCVACVACIACATCITHGTYVPLRARR